QIEEDSASMVARGYMTAADTVAAQKGNTKRSDISGVSFGTALKYRERSAQAYANGARGADLFDDTETVINRQTGQAEQHVRRGKSIEELQQTILDGGMAGAILGQRKEAVQAMVPVL